MVRKRKREEDKSAAAEPHGHDEAVHAPIPVMDAVAAPTIEPVGDGGGEGDTHTGESGTGGEGEEGRRKKRNLHGRYKKKKVPQVAVDKDRCTFDKGEGKMCGKGVLAGWPEKLCRKHAGVKREKKAKEGEAAAVEVVLPVALAKKREDANQRRLEALKEKLKLEQSRKVSLVPANNKKIVFDSDDEGSD